MRNSFQWHSFGSLKGSTKTAQVSLRALWYTITCLLETEGARLLFIFRMTVVPFLLTAVSFLHVWRCLYHIELQKWVGLKSVGRAYTHTHTCRGTVARVVCTCDMAKKSTNILTPEASKNSFTLRYNNNTIVRFLSY